MGKPTPRGRVTFLSVLSHPGPAFLLPLHTSGVDPPGAVPNLTCFQRTQGSGSVRKRLYFPMFAPSLGSCERLRRGCQLESEKTHKYQHLKHQRAKQRGFPGRGTRTGWLILEKPPTRNLRALPASTRYTPFFLSVDKAWMIY